MMQPRIRAMTIMLSVPFITGVTVQPVITDETATVTEHDRRSGGQGGKRPVPNRSGNPEITPRGINLRRVRN
jgi:hypothetical protein